jgi:hypothetical protein
MLPSFVNIRNVLLGQLPDFCLFTFMNVVSRAKRLIGDIDLDEPLDKIKALESFAVDLDTDRFVPTDSMELKTPEPTEEDATVPSLVFNHMHEFESAELQGFTWSQYFGFLALHHVYQAWFLERITDSVKPGDEFVQALPNTLANYAAEATEAVCLGEQLLRKEREDAGIEEKVRASIRQRNTKAAYKRHEKTSQLKQEFIEYYVSGEFPSQAEAARVFLRSIDDDKRTLLAPTNAERTLLDALRMSVKMTESIT